MSSIFILQNSAAGRADISINVIISVNITAVIAVLFFIISLQIRFIFCCFRKRAIPKELPVKIFTSLPASSWGFQVKVSYALI